MNSRGDVENTAGRGVMPAPRNATRIVLLAAALSICFQAYFVYSRNWPGQDYVLLDFVRGTGDAPEQYRTGVILLAYWGMRFLHLRMRYGFTLINTVSAVTSVLLLYRMLRERPVFREGSLLLQWFGSAALCVLAYYFLIWDLWFERPSTLAIVATTVLLLRLWTPHGDREPKRGRMVMLVASLMGLSLAQAFIRADVTVCIAAGAFGVACSSPGDRLALPRRMAMAVSALCFAIGAGVQLYLMKIAYPAATYGQVPVVMIVRERLTPLLLLPFAIFLLPFAWLCLRLYRERPGSDAAGLAFVLAALLFLPLWIVFGKLNEVRIFLPLAMGLIPLTVERLMLDVSGGAA